MLTNRACTPHLPRGPERLPCWPFDRHAAAPAPRRGRYRRGGCVPDVGDRGRARLPDRRRGPRGNRAPGHARTSARPVAARIRTCPPRQRRLGRCAERLHGAGRQLQSCRRQLRHLVLNRRPERRIDRHQRRHQPRRDPCPLCRRGGWRARHQRGDAPLHRDLDRVQAGRVCACRDQPRPAGLSCRDRRPQRGTRRRPVAEDSAARRQSAPERRLDARPHPRGAADLRRAGRNCGMDATRCRRACAGPQAVRMGDRAVRGPRRRHNDLDARRPCDRRDRFSAQAGGAPAADPRPGLRGGAARAGRNAADRAGRPANTASRPAQRPVAMAARRRLRRRRPGAGGTDQPGRTTGRHLRRN